MNPLLETLTIQANHSIVKVMCQQILRDCEHKEDHERCSSNKNPTTALIDCPQFKKNPIRVEDVCASCQAKNERRIRELEALDWKIEHHDHMAKIWNVFAKNCDKDAKFKAATDAWERHDEHSWRASESQKAFDNVTIAIASKPSPKPNSVKISAAGQGEQIEEGGACSESGSEWSVGAVANFYLRHREDSPRQEHGEGEGQGQGS